MDSSKKTRGNARSHSVDLSAELHANEAVSRFVAYLSPYLFWMTVVGLSAGILLMQ